MRFEDRTISVTFQYETEKSAQGAKLLRVTTCKLIAVRPKGKAENGKVIGQAVVRQHPNDPDCKVLARKFALTKAMADVEFNKKLRTRIWKEYFSRTKVLSAGKAVSVA